MHLNLIKTHFQNYTFLLKPQNVKLCLTSFIIWRSLVNNRKIYVSIYIHSRLCIVDIYLLGETCSLLTNKIYLPKSLFSEAFCQLNDSKSFFGFHQTNIYSRWTVLLLQFALHSQLYIEYSLHRIVVENQMPVCIPKTTRKICTYFPYQWI